MDKKFVLRLRQLADQGASIRTMVDEIRQQFDGDDRDGLQFVTVVHFQLAFRVGLLALKGQPFHDDPRGELDAWLLPLIKKNRPQWIGDPIQVNQG